MLNVLVGADRNLKIRLNFSVAQAVFCLVDQIDDFVRVGTLAGRLECCRSYLSCLVKSQINELSATITETVGTPAIHPHGDRMLTSIATARVANRIRGRSMKKVKVDRASSVAR